MRDRLGDWEGAGLPSICRALCRDTDHAVGGPIRGAEGDKSPDVVGSCRRARAHSPPSRLAAASLWSREPRNARGNSHPAGRALLEVFATASTVGDHRGGAVAVRPVWSLASTPSQNRTRGGTRSRPDSRPRTPSCQFDTDNIARAGETRGRLAAEASITLPPRRKSGSDAAVNA
jgi:hypothetical protein